MAECTGAGLVSAVGSSLIWEFGNGARKRQIGWSRFIVQLFRMSSARDMTSAGSESGSWSGILALRKRSSEELQFCLFVGVGKQLC